MQAGAVECKTGHASLAVMAMTRPIQCWRMILAFIVAMIFLLISPEVQSPSLIVPLTPAFRACESAIAVFVILWTYDFARWALGRHFSSTHS
jgi:hypothetical protein